MIHIHRLPLEEEDVDDVDGYVGDGYDGDEDDDHDNDDFLVTIQISIYFDSFLYNRTLI